MDIRTEISKNMRVYQNPNNFNSRAKTQFHDKEFKLKYACADIVFPFPLLREPKNMTEYRIWRVYFINEITKQL